MTTKNAWRWIAGVIVATTAIAISLVGGTRTIYGTGQDVTISSSAILSGDFGKIIVNGGGSETNPLIVAGGHVRCLELSGVYIVASGIDVSGCSSHGIYIKGQHILVQDNEVHGNVLENKSGAICGNAKWGSAIKVYVGAEDVMIRGNHVYENCGEGIGVTRGVQVVVDGNTVWDNFSVNIYVDNSPYTEVYNNVSTCSNPAYYRDGGAAKGIMLGMENYKGWGNQLHDIVIDGNYIVGCKGIRTYTNINGAAPIPPITITNNKFQGVVQPYVSVANSVMSNNVAFTGTVPPATTSTPFIQTSTIVPSLKTLTPTFTLSPAPSLIVATHTSTPTLTLIPTKTPTATFTPISTTCFPIYAGNEKTFIGQYCP